MKSPTLLQGFYLWSHLGSNQGPPDYESGALTNWAIGIHYALKSLSLFVQTMCKPKPGFKICFFNWSQMYYIFQNKKREKRKLHILRKWWTRMEGSMTDW